MGKMSLNDCKGKSPMAHWHDMLSIKLKAHVK